MTWYETDTDSEVEPGVCNMSEHSLANMFCLLIVKTDRETNPIVLKTEAVTLDYVGQHWLNSYKVPWKSWWMNVFM